MSVRLHLAEVSELWLARPEKFNAMNWEMARGVADALIQVEKYERARVLVVRGEGKAFCAGGDFEMLEANVNNPAETNRQNMYQFYQHFLGALQLPIPTLAVLHGATIGAGLCFAMACDLRIATQKAKLGANFVRVGLHPGMGGSLLLPHLVGRTRANDLLLSGRLIPGDEAERIGLVNQAVPEEQLEASVNTQINELLKADPISARQLKETLNAPILRDLDQSLRREAACQAVNFASDFIKETVERFNTSKPS